LKVAEELRQGVENLKIPHEASRVSPYVTISIGTATMIPDLKSEAKDIVEKADKALYKAKQGGRNRTEGDVSS
jgi:diguanylate cyclase (GGDEF)-like protein